MFPQSTGITPSFFLMYLKITNEAYKIDFNYIHKSIILIVQREKYNLTTLLSNINPIDSTGKKRKTLPDKIQEMFTDI